jgi:hypothetical protein
LKFQSYYCCCY